MKTVGILNVSNIEAAGMSLDVLEHADATDTVSTDNEDLSAILVLNEALNFSGLKVQLYYDRVSIFNI